jgi:hypothetical protein
MAEIGRPQLVKNQVVIEDMLPLKAEKNRNGVWPLTWGLLKLWKI